MKPKSLSSRLVLVTAVALAPAFLITSYSLISLSGAQKDDLHREAMQIAELVSLELEQTIAGTEGVLRAIGADQIVKQGQEADCSALLDEITGGIDHLRAVQILNADGSEKCSSGSASSEVDRDWLATIASGESVVGRVVREGPTSEMFLPIALRLEDDDTAYSGIAVAYLDLDWLEARLQNRTLADGGALTIADRGGTIVARVPEPERFVGTTIPDQYLVLVRASTPGSTELVSQDGTNRIVGYYPPAANGAGLYVSAGLSRSEGYAAFRSVAYRAAVLSVAGILLTGAFAYFTAKAFVARPVQKLIDTVAAWRNGDIAARTGLDSREGEICRAGESMDSFMDELLAAREARRKADAARDLMRDELEHREKNLMATVQAIARQTFSKTGDDAAYQTFVQRLGAIGTANGLLKQSSWQSTSLADLVARTVATFVGKDQARISVTGPQVMIKASVATVLAMSIHELCTNAVKYGALSNDVGAISITWTLSGTAEDQTLTVSWIERGGPVVRKPQRTGFGSRVIKDALAAQTNGEVEMLLDPLGLTFRLTAPAQAILALPDIAEPPVTVGRTNGELRQAEA